MEGKLVTEPGLCPQCAQPLGSLELLYPGWGYCYRCHCWRHADGTANGSDEQPDRQLNWIEENPREY